MHSQPTLVCYIQASALRPAINGRPQCSIPPTGPEPALLKWGGSRTRWSELNRARSAAARGVWGHAPPGKFWDFRPSKIVSSEIAKF